MQKQGKIQEMLVSNLGAEIEEYRTVECFGDLGVDETLPYFINHVPSGFAVIKSSFKPSREEVIAVAIEIAPLFDDMPGDKTCPTKDNAEYTAWALEVAAKIAERAVALGDLEYKKFLSQ